MARLTVAMNGIEVAHLTKDTRGGMDFQYLPAWLTRSGARAISLSLPLTREVYRGERVYNFFDNLLPDSETLRTRMQSRFQVPTSHPFDLLASVGRDCIGAIQLYPEGDPLPPINQISATPLSDGDIASLLQGYQSAPLGMAENDDFRISLAGAQEKTALLWHKGCWQKPVGSTPTSHIFKLPIGFLEHSNIDLRKSSENEWLCLKILAAFGLPVANAELARFEDQTVLIVERFDRRWASDQSWLMRLPQEDFCQALGVAPAIKYENDGGPGIQQAMKLLQGSQQAHEDRERFIKSQLLFWLLAAIDGHAKNFSVSIEPSSAYRMTPLYDVISALPLIDKGSLPVKRAKMAMSVKGKNRHYHWQRIEPRHFLTTARGAGFSQRRTKELMAEIAENTDKVINQVATGLPEAFPETVSRPIFDGMQSQSDKLRQFLAAEGDG
ncbi:MAG: type II toxin-antitoxin system HipA family toxin [Alteromonadaceae bacterium]|nr:type II toxin-antitoxin system HipA family toxin [Alteromonadaceae bacterium]